MYGTVIIIADFVCDMFNVIELLGFLVEYNTNNVID